MVSIVGRAAARGALVALLLAGAAPAAMAAATTRVSVSSAGGQGDAYSGDASISGNGRIVAFASDADDLVANDTNGSRDVFVHDRGTGQTRLVSVNNAGVKGNDTSRGPLITREARRVVFESSASNLVANDTNGRPDLFLRDLEADTTIRLSLAPGGGQFTDSSIQGTSISADAQVAAFAVNFGQGPDSVGFYVRDVKAGTTTLVNRNADGEQGDGFVFTSSTSGDGRLVAFDSNATNLAQGATSGEAQVYLHDRGANTLSLASLDRTGTAAGNGQSSCPALAPNARLLAFCSTATNLVAGTAQPPGDRYLAYVRDLATGKTSRLDVVPGGGIPGQDVYVEGISGDGRRVLILTALALSPLDTNGVEDLYAFDRATGQSVLASAKASGRSAKGAIIAAGDISNNGRAVVFDSAAAMVPGDTNGERDTYVRQLPPLPAAARANR